MLSFGENVENVTVESAKNSTVELTETRKSVTNEPESTYKMRLELAAFLVYFGVNLPFAVFQDEVLYQTCTVVYGYNETMCQDLIAGKAISDPAIQAVENVVQPFAAQIFMAETFVKAIVPAFLALFIGSWTDKFGRKPIIQSTIAGFFCFAFIKTIIAGISLAQGVNPWLYIIASIPLSLSGGECALMTALYCYVADSTTIRERPSRMFVMAGTIAFAAVFGQILSSYIYKATNACTIFAIAAAAMLIALIYVVVVIEESIKMNISSAESKWKGFVDGKLLKDMLKTVFKKREGFQTAIMWCIMISVTIVSFDAAGLGDVFFLYLRKKFGWTVQDVTTFNASGLVITYVGAAVGTFVLQYKLRIRLTIMTFIAYGSYLVLTLIYTTAFASWYLYFGVTITCLSGFAIPMGQSMLANAVPPSDMGKVFALVSVMQAISPLVASPLYTSVYNSTLETLPGAFNLISAGLYMLAISLIVFVHVVDMRCPKVNADKSK